MVTTSDDFNFLNEVSSLAFSKRGKDFGLTFPEAGATSKEMVFQALKGLIISRSSVVDLLLCEEIGKESKRRHYHAYIKFGKKVTVNERTFDVCGLHPHIDNVKRNNARNIEPMIRYLTKEDKSPLSTFNWKKILEKKKVTTTPPWNDWINEGLTQKQVIDRLINSEWCGKFFDKYFNWSAAIKKCFKDEVEADYEPDPSHEFWLPAELLMWKEFYFDGWNGKDRPRNLVLIGASRLGKTCWARSLGKHMYFNNLLNLDEWDESKDFIILDDFAPEFTKYFPAWKCFFGSQKQFTLTDKYRGKKTVHWGKPMIWLCNEDFRKYLNNEQLEFIEKNCFVYRLESKLY